MQEIEPQLFQSFCDAMPLAVCLVDFEGRILYWNAAAEAITGYLSQEVLGRAYRGDLLIGCEHGEGSDSNAGLQCPVREVLRDGLAVAADMFLRHKDGHRKVVHVEAFVLRDGRGEMRGVAEILDCSQGRHDFVAWPANSERKFEAAMDLPAVEESIEHLQRMLASHPDSSPALILIAMTERHALLQHGGTALLRQALRVLCKTVAGLMPPRSYVGCWSQDRLLVLVPDCSQEELEELKRKLARVGSLCALKWWGDRLAVETAVAACHLHPSQTADSVIAALERELKNNGKE